MNVHSLAQFAHLINAPFEGEAEITSVHVDSRQICPGGIFFALPGVRTHGEAFLEKAKEAGAVAAVVQKNYEGPSHDLGLIRVPDVLEALQESSRAYLAQKKCKVVAVTGSMGKTTIKHFTFQILAAEKKVIATRGNQNTQIGVPLTIFDLSDEEVLLLEMGMTEPGNLARLVEIAPPQIALLSMVDFVHAEFFEGLEDIARAKAEIFSSEATTLGLVADEVPYRSFYELKSSGRFSTFSTQNPNCAYYLKREGEGFDLYERGQKVLGGRLNVLGEHNHHNLLAAMVLARNVGLSWEKIAEKLPILSLPDMRMDLLEREGVTIVCDAYNSNLQSIRAALHSLPLAKSGRTVLALSEIRELGTWAQKVHEELAELLSSDVYAHTFLIGPAARIVHEKRQGQGLGTSFFENREKMFAAMRSFLEPGDVLLLKGSRFWALEGFLEEGLVGK